MKTADITEFVSELRSKFPDVLSEINPDRMEEEEFKKSIVRSSREILTYVIESKHPGAAAMVFMAGMVVFAALDSLDSLEYVENSDEFMKEIGQYLE